MNPHCLTFEQIIILGNLIFISIVLLTPVFIKLVVMDGNEQIQIVNIFSYCIVIEY